MAVVRGVAPQGYLNKRGDDNQPTVIIDPERFYVLQRMFKLYLTGNYTVVDLLSILNEEYHFTTLRRKKRGGKPLTIAGLDGFWKTRFIWARFETLKIKTSYIKERGRQ